MRKAFALLLCAAMIFTVTACSGSDSVAESAVESSAAPIAPNYLKAVIVADSVEDAFPDIDYSDKPSDQFISPTTSLKIGSSWYGIMYAKDLEGMDEGSYSVDIYGKIGESETGGPWFELYYKPDHSDEVPVLSTYIDLYDDYFEAKIGNQDAWILTKYLTAADAMYFSPYLDNGALTMNYSYFNEKEGYSIPITFVLREYGAPWDEKVDPLPPGYEEYKATLES